MKRLLIFSICVALFGTMLVGCSSDKGDNRPPKREYRYRKDQNKKQRRPKPKRDPKVKTVKPAIITDPADF